MDAEGDLMEALGDGLVKRRRAGRWRKAPGMLGEICGRGRMLGGVFNTGWCWEVA